MEFITQFLSSVNSSGAFMINIDGDNQFGAKCIIRSCFIEIGYPNTRYVFFLPDYVGILEESSKNKVGCLHFEPINRTTKSFTLSTSDTQILSIWHYFSANSRDLFDEMIKLSIGSPILLSEVFGVFGNHPNLSKNPQGLLVKIENNVLYFYEHKNNSLIFELLIHSQLNIVIESNKSSISLKINDFNLNYEIFLGNVLFETIEKWYLSLYICKENNSKKDQDIINEICNSVSDIDIKINDSNDLESENNLNIKNIEEKLEKDLKNYQNNFFQPLPIPEPELEKIDKTQFLPSKFILPSPIINQSFTEISKDHLMNLISDRFTNPISNFTFYNQNINNSLISIPNLNYNKDSLKKIENYYKNSNDIDSFILLCSIILNGFKGDSLSFFFDVEPLPGESIQFEVTKITQIHLTNIFNILLSKKDLNLYYNIDSIVLDKELLINLSKISKNLENPGILSDNLPYMFSHQPLKLFISWYFDTIYLIKINKLDFKNCILLLSYNFYQLFSNHLIENNNPIIFLRLISSKMFGPIRFVGNWQYLWGNLENEKNWNNFWVYTFKEKKLLQTFLNIFQYPDLIMENYDDCAMIRSSSVLSEIIKFLTNFESLLSSIDINIKIDQINDNIGYFSFLNLKNKK